MEVLMRRVLSAFVGAIGILSILASGGGGGSDSGDSNVTPSNITQAKTLVGDTRSFATTFRDIEDPAQSFGSTIGNAEVVSGKCSAAALDALSVATMNALELYQANSAADGTYLFQTDDGLGGNPVNASVVVSSPSGGSDQISMDGQSVYGGDDEGGATLNTVDLTITLPIDSDTSTATPLNATVSAEVTCPENQNEAGIVVSLNGTLAIVRQQGASGPTIENIASLNFDGGVTIGQTQSQTVTNPVSIEGTLTLSLSGCTLDDCSNLSLLISGTLSDLTESTTVELGISKTATEAVVSIGFNAILDGETREIEVTFRADITDPENPVPTQVAIEITGPDGGITITADQFNADGAPTRVSISDGDGAVMTITNLNSDGPVLGNITVDGEIVGTLERNGSGDLIIRYTDGTFETFA